MFGVYRRDADLDVVGTTYYGLYALQHRGQESCGMAVNDDGVFYKRPRAGPCERRVHQGRAGDDAPGQYVHRPLPLCHHGRARPRPTRSPL